MKKLLTKYYKSHWFVFTGQLFVVAGFVFMIAFFRTYHLPKIKSWLLIEVEKQSQANTPFRVWPQNVELHFFPPGIELQDVRILPKSELKKQLAPAHIDGLQVNISILGLIQGKIRASNVIVKNPSLAFIFKDNIADTFFKKRSPQRSSPALTLDTIFRLPLDKFEIQGLKVQALFNGENIALQMLDASLSVENKYKSLLVKNDFPKITLKQLGDRPNLELSIDSKFLVEENGFSISALKVKAEKSFLVASGKILGNVEKFEFNNTDINARLFLQLEDLSSLVPAIDESVVLPRMIGSIGMDTRLNYDFKKKSVNGTYTLETKNVSVQDRLIGGVRSSGSFNGDTLKSNSISISNSTGSASLENFKLSFNENLSLSGQVSSNGINFRPFMTSIGLENIPVDAMLSGNLPCSGQLKSPLSIKCAGTVGSKNLHVYTQQKGLKKTIVKIKDMNAKGKVTITDKLVTYEANLNAGKKSKGSSKGKISYKDGFDITFIGKRVSLDDVENLVNLKMEGEAALQGRTKGTSKWGQVDIDLRAKKFWLEDFGLGNVDTKMRYKDGKLTFSKLKGQFRSTRYEGLVTLDLRKSEIFISQNLPFIELNDVQSLFSKKLKLPIEISGTGSGNFKAWGPLNFWRMSYNLESSFYRGEIANETFDKGIVNIESKDGFITAQQVELKKAQSIVELNGKMNPNKEIDAVVIGRQIRLEQSENISKIGLDIAGQFDSSLLLKGSVLDPQMVLKGRLKKLVIGDTPADDSSFSLDIMKDRLEGDVNFIGKTVQSNFIIPYNKNAPFKFYLKTTNWDFTNLFTLLSSTAQKKDFTTQINSEVNLTSDRGGFWNSTGKIGISSFLIQRGPLKMNSAGPMELSVNKGVINSKDLYLRGDGTFLNIDIINASKDKLNADINGKIDLSLVSLVTPFLDDLRGTMSMALKTQGSLTNPEIIGSSYIENGYVKLNNFPHPFDQINADLLFNQKSIVINALKATLGGGPLKGEGKITLKSNSNIPIDIRAQFEDVALNIPEGMRTKGSGQIKISGNKFPYLIKGSYGVIYGDVTTDFGTSSGKSNEVKPSEFLPKFLTKDEFQPITLDLEIDIKKPVSVKNSLIDAQAKGKISVLGTPDSLTLDGILRPVVGGIIKFKDTNFEISSGYVDFKSSAPSRPTVYLTARARVVEETINPNTGREESINYEVELLVQGTAPDLNINLESSPPLSNQQIVSLLALGITQASTIDDSYNPNAQATADNALASGVIGTQIGSQLIGRGISEPLKERLGVDVKISTSLNTVENATYPKVIFSKQWTPKWETSASRTIENNPRSDVKFEYRLNNNLSFIGLWEGREQSPDTDQEIEQNMIGVDVEYRVNFK